MKRYIHAATKKINEADARNFCSMVNELLSQSLAKDYEFKLSVNSSNKSKIKFVLDNPYYTITSDDIRFLNDNNYQDDIYAYYLDNNVEGAASYITQIIKKGIQDNQVISSTDYDDFLADYEYYLDAIASVVSSVAAKYDSDMEYHWRDVDRSTKRTLVDWIFTYESIYFSERQLTVSYALGMTAVQTKLGEFPTKYESSDGTIIDGPLAIVYNGDSVNPKLKYFDADLKRLQIAMEDYFKRLAYIADTGDKYGGHVRHKDSYSEREEERKAREAESKKLRSVRKNWNSIIRAIKQSFNEGIDDPLYEDTEAGDYITSICQEVEDKMDIYVEPSVQGGKGIVNFYTSDEDSEITNIYDYQSFNDEIINLVLASKNMTQFKQAYQSYLESLVADYE